MNYMLPNGEMISEEEAKKLIKEKKYQLHKPSCQGNSEEEEQIGIKHA